MKWLVIGTGIVVILVIAMVRDQRRGVPPPSVWAQRYRPARVAARTPSGITVAVSCPHLSGHRTPDAAVACAQRVKARIEAYGR